MQLSRFAIFAFALAASHPMAASTILYTDWSGSTADSPGGQAFHASDTGKAAFELAVPFSPTQTGTLDSVDVPMNIIFLAYPNNDFFNNFVAITITRDAGGTPGSVLESYTVNPNDPSTDPTPDAYTIDSVLHPLLSAGSTYWITWAAAPIPFGCCAPQDGLYLNDLGITSGTEYSSDGSTWNSLSDLNPGFPVYAPSFDVNGTVATPELSSAIFVLGGLLGLGIYRRRRDC